MNSAVRVACVQAEPAILDRAGTLDKVAALTAEAATGGAQLVVFPETFVPAYPSSAWAKFLAGWTDPRAKAAYAMLARESLDVPGPDCDRLGEIAREHEVWLVTGVNERDPERPGTLYNSLLYHGPDGRLVQHHRKLVPTNHERMVWGQGDGGGLRAIQTPLGRIGGLICWENYMPLARFSLYESGVEIYIASTADDGDAWQATLVHIARESRAFVVSPCHFQRGPSYPADFPLREEIVKHRPARPRRLGDPRAGRRLPRRAALRRGRDPLRRPRPRAAVRRAAALRPRRPLSPPGRAQADGDQRSQWTIESRGARTAGLKSVPIVYATGISAACITSS